MLTCKLCHTAKPDSDFYVSCRVTCRECFKARQRARYASEADSHREFDRARSKLPTRRAYLNAASRKYRANNKAKRAARVVVGNAIRDGRLKRQPCDVCGRTRDVHAHHDDYAKPLEVRWLCVAHHHAHHQELARAS